MYVLLVQVPPAFGRIGSNEAICKISDVARGVHFMQATRSNMQCSRIWVVLLTTRDIGSGQSAPFAPLHMIAEVMCEMLRDTTRI